MNPITERVTSNLRIARTEANLTQQELADKLKCSKGRVTQWELGLREVKHEALFELAPALGKSWLWFYDHDPSPKVWPHEVAEDGTQLYLGEFWVETSKTGKPRSVPLNWQAAAIIRQRILEAEANSTTYLFGGDGADRFAEACSWTKRVFQRALRKGEAHGHFHGLRHHGAQVAYSNGAPVEAISKLLGHSSLVQTEHYLGLKENLAWQACFATGKGMRQEANPWAIFDKALAKTG